MKKTLSLIAAATLAAGALANPAAEPVDAEVMRIDRETARITLKHAPIKHLDMPSMTMVFHVKDKAMLDGVQQRDKVKVIVVQEAGRYTVTDLRLVK
jgi:Cu(I)/Ag(I) efflux system protein CusF